MLNQLARRKELLCADVADKWTFTGVLPTVLSN
jgi:hypothetical protein